MTEELEDYRRLDEDRLFKHQPRYHSRARSAWYVYGHKDGKAYIVKASDEEDASRINFAKFDGRGAIEELNTINIATATQMIKAKWLHQHQTLEEAARRASHKEIER